MADNPLDEGIFREVDDDLKREKLEKFWEEYGNTIIACVVILILGTAASSFTQHYKQQKYIAQTDQLISYVEQAPTLSEEDRLAKLTALTSETKGGAGAILLLQLGAQQYQAGKLDAALITYEQAKDAGIDDIYEDMAELQIIRIRMEKGDDAALLIEEAEKLAEAEAPFRFSAREVLGLLKKQMGDLDGANIIFQNLSMNGLAPESLRQRAAAYISYDQGGQSWDLFSS